MGPSAETSPPIDLVKANALLAEVDAHPTVADMARTARVLGPHRSTLAAVSLRVGCVSSFTFDPIRPALELQGLRAGFALETYVAPFGRFDQELIDPASGLASFEPEVVFLSVRLRDVCPALYEGFNGLSASEATRLVDEAIERLGAGLFSFRKHCGAEVLIQNYELPARPALGIADRGAPVSQYATIGRANEALAALAGSLENVRVMDYDVLVALHGRGNWTDPRMALFARMAVAPKYYWELAGFYVRHLRPRYGLSKKVLVLDADNTLWGGVVGDVELEGIELGPEYPGNAYVAFQKRVLDLYHRGVILGIASKNDPGVVEEVLARHPNMVLRAEHFAALRIDWGPKPDNLRQMAEDLNLGLDSFVFVDDSAVECEMMSRALPEVLTIRLPADPADYAGIIESLDCFDQWTVSGEDRKRGQLYKAEVHRRAARTAVVDLPSFYRHLEMKATISVDDRSQVGRAAQMTNRTNQFNMHKIRCSEDDVRGFMEAEDHRVITLALQDRFGDNGVVGLAVVRCLAHEWVLHLLLMSCRVLGRTVEEALVGWIGEQARVGGAGRLVGEFVPTAKNKSFAGFYESCGFTAADPEGEMQRWVWALEAADTTPPDWIDVVVKQPSEKSA